MTSQQENSQSTIKKQLQTSLEKKISQEFQGRTKKVAEDLGHAQRIILTWRDLLVQIVDQVDDLENVKKVCAEALELVKFDGSPGDKWERHEKDLTGKDPKSENLKTS